MIDVLLIEDEDRGVRQATHDIRAVFPDASITVAGDLATAIQFLSDTGFDLVVCDLRIMAVPGSSAADVSHGQLAHAEAMRIQPGTPVIMLSAVANSENTSRQLEEGDRKDAFGVSRLKMSQLAIKGTTQFRERLQVIADGIADLGECQVTYEGDPLGLLSERASQMYGRFVSSRAAHVRPRKGKSKADVALVTFDQPEVGPVTVVLKVGPRDEMESEIARIDRYVSNRLRPGQFAPLSRQMLHGLRKSGATISTLADPAGASVFERLKLDPAAGPAVVESIMTSVAPWSSIAPNTVRLGSLRQVRTSDARLDSYRALLGDKLLELEDFELDVGKKICHGDLHGANILMDPGGRAVLIDFGDTGVHAAALDTVTFEMSLYLHSEGPARGEPLNFSEWAEVNAFASRSAFADAIQAARRWSLEVYGEPAMLAVAYAHAIRQLKYSDTDHDAALGIARSALERLRDVA